MRRPIKQRPQKVAFGATTMSRELDWLVDQWRDSRPEERLSIVLAKIRAEERIDKPEERLD